MDASQHPKRGLAEELCETESKRLRPEITSEEHILEAEDRPSVGRRYLALPELPGLSRSGRSNSSQISDNSSAASSPGDSSHARICYGSIKAWRNDQLQDLMVKLHTLPKNLGTQQSYSYGGQIYVPVDIHLENSLCQVVVQGDIIGILENRVAQVLSSLPDPDSMHFEGLIAETEWKEKLRKLDKSSKGVLLGIEVNIYGDRTNADKVGEGLYRSSFFLQPPVPGTATSPYENPQALDTTGFDIVQDIFMHGDLPSIVLDPTLAVTGARIQTSWLSMPDLIFDKLPALKQLVEADVDRRVQTELLKHQREAVDFVQKREAGTWAEASNLWERLDEEQQPQVYRHTITGAKRPNAEDCLGGVLADDMGLGKSLSMLSVIVASLERARENLAKKHDIGHDKVGTIQGTATLIVVPSTLLLDSWLDEIERHIKPGTLRTYRYHGRQRSVDWNELANYDIVLSTYGTLTSDINRRRGTLDRIIWYRIILDEAHIIRNCSTKQFQAIRSIPTQLRWCLSGTPIQNTLDDLGSIIQFLRLPIMDDGPTYRKYISSRTKSVSVLSSGDWKNLQILLQSICLRRKRMTLPLSEPIMETKRIQLTEDEMRHYQKLESDLLQLLKLAVGQSSKNAHSSCLESVIRLRLFCNHGVRELARITSSAMDPEIMFSIYQQRHAAVCQRCNDEITNAYGPDKSQVCLTSCDRLLCHDCAAQYRERSESESCPACNKVHPLGVRHTQFISKLPPSIEKTTTYPTKLQVLIDDLERHVETDKSIVFSAWKQSLNLIEEMLKENGLQYCRVDGSLSLGQRRKVLNEFQQDPSKRIILITLGTGAVGLNSLTVANRVHLLEPQWNPSIENQAIGRVQRLGQEKRVTIIRYITEKTIEKSVQSRQVRKEDLATGGFNSIKEAEDVALIQQIKDLLNHEH